MDGRAKRAAGLMLYSFGCLAYEVALVMLLPSVVGLVRFGQGAALVAMAAFLVGSGLGAALSSSWRGGRTGSLVLAQAACMLAFPSLVGALFPSEPPPLSVALALAAAPLVCAGLVVSRALDAAGREGWLARLYSSDLAGAFLGGATCGWLLVPGLGMAPTLVASAACVVVGAMLLGALEGPGLVPAAIAAALAASLALGGAGVGPPGCARGTGARLLFDGWSPLQRISIVQDGEGSWFCLHGLRASAIDIPMPPNITLTGNEALSWLLERLRSGRVLVVGPGGGFRDVQKARLARLRDPSVAREVVAVEVEPLMVSTLKGPFSSLNGGLYLAPGVEVVNADALGFLAGAGGRFDLVVYSRVRDVPAYGAYVLSEERLLAKEGLRSAAAALAPGGTVAVILGEVQPHQQETLLSTLASLSRELFPSDPWQGHVRLVPAAQSQPDLQSAILLLSESSQDLERFDDAALPLDAMEALAAGHPPLTMDRPFLYSFPADRVPDLIQRPLAAALALALVALAAAGRAIRGRAREPSRALALLAAVMAAAAWSWCLQGLLVARGAELSGASLPATTTLVSAFLLFGGLGSLLSERAGGRVPCILALAALYGSALSWALPRVVAPAMPLWASLALLALSAAPLALANGMVFPGALSLARRVEPAVGAPWALAADAAGTAVGVFAAVALPFLLGYGLSLAALPLVSLLPAALLWALGREGGTGGT